MATVCPSSWEVRFDLGDTICARVFRARIILGCFHYTRNQEHREILSGDLWEPRRVSERQTRDSAPRLTGQLRDLCHCLHTTPAIRGTLYLMNRINRRSLLSSAATLAGAGLLSHSKVAAAQNHTHSDAGQSASAHNHVHSVSLITETANRFLAALGPDQRAKAPFKFDDDERMNWHFIPKERKGLPLREMSPYQRHLASALLASGLSQTGFTKP